MTPFNNEDNQQTKKNHSHNRKRNRQHETTTRKGNPTQLVRFNNEDNQQTKKNHSHNRKRNRQHETSTRKGNPAQLVQLSQNHCDGRVLEWYSPYDYVPIEVEKRLVKVIIRWGKTEHGMMKNQPSFRLKEIRKAIRDNNESILLIQALSLRRHHMKILNPKKPMVQLGLGKTSDINQSALLFENAVQAYLDQCNVQYVTQEQQHERLRSSKKPMPMPPTPDFMLQQPMQLVLYNVDKKQGPPQNYHKHRRNSSNKNISRYQQIQWIEAKMFYGASTIKEDGYSAVGRILETARKYTSHYGPGAMVFSYGCGDLLAKELLKLNVIPLDSWPLDTRQVEQHQRTWCGNESGLILP